MLARRFTIVCLVAAIFGMTMSALVAKSGRAARSWEIGKVTPCVWDEGLRCARPHR